MFISFDANQQIIQGDLNVYDLFPFIPMQLPDTADPGCVLQGSNSSVNVSAQGSATSCDCD